MSSLQFVPEPFNPHPLLQNAHIQTILGRFFRDHNGIQYRRERLETPDRDFIDLDFAQIPGYTWEDLGDPAPILLLLHGLEGSAQSSYAQELYMGAAQAGFRCVGMNFRSCSGEMNRTQRLYHMGATDDVGLVHEWLEEQFPDVDIFLVGVSLGGNMTLKYLGENGKTVCGRIQGACAVSPPLIATGTQPLNDTWTGRIYGEFLLRNLRRKTREKAAILKNSQADYERAIHARIMRDFDEAITAPLHGFHDADDYYARSQSANFLSGIRVPTLLIRSLDDPVFTQEIPYDDIQSNSAIIPAFTNYGGHVGFIEGVPPVKFNNWARRQILRFFRTIQEREHALSRDHILGS